MPFSYIIGELSARTQEARELLSAASHPGITPDAQRSIRGMIYVSLFGIYEYVAHEVVKAAIAEANSHSIAIEDIAWGLVPFALHRELSSFRDGSIARRWISSLALVKRTASSDIAICDDVFPSDESYMKPSQMELIFELFALPVSPWPDMRFVGRIHEMRGARNNIAHGSSTAGDYGGRLSDAEMKDRIDDVETLCSHIVLSFQSNMSTKAIFLR
jgi:hypothetical protein